MSDGLAGEERLPLLATLQTKSEVTIFEESAPIFGLAPVVLQDGVVIVEALRNRSGTAQDIIVNAVGRDPAGIERVLTQVPLSFAASDMSAQAEIVLPAELRNRVSRFEIEGIATAGAVTLSDDGLRRREIALIDGRSAGEGAQLLSQLYYLERALRPTADLIQGALPDALLANPDVIVLADVANLTQAETQGLTDWVESGGLLLRFSGPRLAASDVARGAQDPLCPYACDLVGVQLAVRCRGASQSRLRHLLLIHRFMASMFLRMLRSTASLLQSLIRIWHSAFWLN